MSNQEKQHLSQKLALVLANKTQLWPVIRGQYLFYQAMLLRKIIGLGEGVILDENVRMQRLSSIFTQSSSSSLHIGANSIVYENAKLHVFGNGRLEIGENSVIGDTKIFVRANTQIGARFLSSWGVLIQDFDPHPVDSELRKEQVELIVQRSKPNFGKSVSMLERKYKEGQYKGDFSEQSISIGDDVWLGANSIVLKGAKIGGGCVVAAGAVVTAGEYSANSILVGNPARALPKPST